MYLHVGQSVVVPFGDVIGIFDMDNTTASKLTRKTLEQSEQRGQVVNVSEDLPKSFILCQQRKKRGRKIQPAAFYLSQLTSSTLLRRAESGLFE